MTPARFDDLTARFPGLRVGVIGDFSLDRYFDIDPLRAELSIETGLPVHHVTRVRCQPGAAGNILANAAALGARELRPIGYCGDDGEGFELLRALRRVPGVVLDDFSPAPPRHTFTYTKPLLHRAGRPPEELSRLDLKDCTPLPADLEMRLADAVRRLAPSLDALIVMDQAGLAGCGAITARVLAAIADAARAHPALLILADSRHGLGRFPPVGWKMNAAEFAALTDPAFHVLREKRSGAEGAEHPAGEASAVSAAAVPIIPPPADLCAGAERLAAKNGRPVFITLAENGIIGAAPDAPAVHVPAPPVRGEIDIVGAGDTVTATLALALAAGASIVEAMTLAQAAASIVVHQLGTTGTASPPEMRTLLFSSDSPASTPANVD